MARLLKVALLPVDLVRLTRDFLKLTEWHLARAVAGFIGVTGPISGPFCARRVRAVDASSMPCTVCLHADRYANVWVFRALCGWVSNERVTGTGRACVCRRRRSYRTPLLRYASVGAAIGLIWAVVCRGAVHWVMGR